MVLRPNRFSAPERRWLFGVSFHTWCTHFSVTKSTLPLIISVRIADRSVSAEERGENDLHGLTGAVIFLCPESLTHVYTLPVFFPGRSM